MDSQVDFPSFAPYSDVKKSSWKFKVVPKSAWQRIENLQKMNEEQPQRSEIKINTCLIKKHQFNNNLKDDDILIPKNKYPNLKELNQKTKGTCHSVSIT